MEKQLKSQTGKDFIKVKFESQGKIYNKLVSCKDTDYKEFAKKLKAGLNLHTQKYYRLFYIDHTKEEIDISSQQDYEVLILKMQKLILYLQESKDQQDHFCKSIQIMDEYQILKERLNQKNQQLDQLNKKYKNLDMKEVRDKIQTKCDFLEEELKKFKQYIKRKIKKKLQEQLQQIDAGVENNPKNAKYTFIHKVSCQSSISECCFKKNIVGQRNRCIICQYDFCYTCSQREFATKNGIKHDCTHPMIEFKEDRWDSKVKFKTQQKNLTKPKQKQQIVVRINPKLKQKQDEEILIKNVAQMLEWPIPQVRQFRNKYPHLTLKELIEKAFEI